MLVCEVVQCPFDWHAEVVNRSALRWSPAFAGQFGGLFLGNNRGIRGDHVHSPAEVSDASGGGGEYLEVRRAADGQGEEIMDSFPQQVHGANILLGAVVG